MMGSEAVLQVPGAFRNVILLGVGALQCVRERCLTPGAHPTAAKHHDELTMPLIPLMR